MSDSSPEGIGAGSVDGSSGNRWIGWIVKAMFGVSACFVVLALVPLETLFHLTAGWIPFIFSNVPLVTVDWTRVGTSLSVLAVATSVLHRLGCRFMSAWPPRATLSVTALLLLLFGSAVLGAGIAHQLAWLGSSGVYDRDRIRSLSVRSQISEAGRECVVFAMENDGQLPDSPEDVGNHLNGERMAARSHWWGSVHEGLVYLGKGMTTDMKPHLPLIVTPRALSSSGLYLVCRLDGNTDKLDREAFRALMDEWRSEMAKRKPDQP